MSSVGVSMGSGRCVNEEWVGVNEEWLGYE